MKSRKVLAHLIAFVMVVSLFNGLALNAFAAAPTLTLGWNYPSTLND